MGGCVMVEVSQQTRRGSSKALPAFLSLDEDRVSVTLEATAEIEALCDFALASIRTTSPDSLYFVMRGMFARIKGLNSAVMSALDECDMDTAAIESKVHAVQRRGLHG